MMLRSREAESRLKISYTVMNNGIIVKTRGLRILGGGLFLLGSLLLAVSILFLTILTCGLLVGGSCTVVPSHANRHSCIGVHAPGGDRDRVVIS